MIDFLIGGLGRSGSQMLLSILNQNSHILVKGEINWSFTGKTDVYSSQELNDLIQRGKVEGVLDFILSEKVRRNSFLFDVRKRQDFVEYLDKEGLSLESLLKGLIYFDEAYDNQDVIGLKFPVSFDRINWFKSRYGVNKVILLKRDPRAIYASELIMKKRITNGSQFPVHGGVFFRPLVFLYVAYQWFRYSRFLKKNVNSADMFLIDYDNFIRNPHSELEVLSGFLNTPISNNSVQQIDVIDSSHSRVGRQGVSTESSQKWKQKLSLVEKVLWRFILFFAPYEK